MILAIVNIFCLVACVVAMLHMDQGDVNADYNPAEGAWDDTERYEVYSTPPLKKGVYTVSVQYEADNDAYTLRCIATEDGGSYPVVYADEYRLDSLHDHLVFHLWVNSDIDYLLVRVETEQPEESICINQINLKREFRKTFVYLMLKVCIFLLALDVILISVWKWDILRQKIGDHLYVLLGLGCIFAVTSFPVISNYQIAGHDIRFHWARIVGLAESLAAGDFPVRIQQGWGNGYGYAVSIFYGDILLYIPAIFYALGIPLIYVYKFYVLCVNAATIGISYFCYKRLAQSKYIGVVCTALYCISINRIMNVNLRMAVGEYSAYMFLPLVLPGFKEIFCPGEEEHCEKYGWIFLCIGMTGIIQTHVLSFEMACIFIGMAVIVLWRRLLDRKVLFAFLKSIAVTICLNLSFLLPFLDYSAQDIQIMKEKGNYGIQGQGLSLYELFAVPISGRGSAKSSIEGIQSRFPISLGLGFTCVIILTVIMLGKYTWNRNEKKRLLFATGFAGVAVLMSTYYWPWNRLAVIPFVGNIVSSIQFPWRFISVAMPILAYVACLVFMKMKKLISWDKMKFLLAGICVITAIQGLYCTDQIIRNGSNYVKYDGQDILETEKSFFGAEYLLVNTHRNRLQGEVDIVGQNVIINDMERKGNSFRIFCEAGQDAYLEVPLFAYKYYHCTDTQTGEEFPITRGDNNKIHVDLPADYRGNLAVYFTEPWYWRASEVISFVTMIILIVYMNSLRNPNKKAKNVGEDQIGINAGTELTPPRM